MLRRAVHVLGLAALTMLVASPAAAQTQPKILETGIERPASAIFIGNSFFYYNNSLHNHVRLLLRSADPLPLPRHVGDDQRLGRRLA